MTGERFRFVLGHVPTSVTVVAAVTPDGPKGLSVGTFVPVSLEPPLVGFFVARTSSSWPPIAAGEAFSVSVLGEDQAELSGRFAVPDTDKFAGVDWDPAPSGHPVVAGCVAWVDCALADEHEAGDHVLVLGEVLALGVGEGDHGPLLHHRGGYRRVRDLAPSSGPPATAPDGVA